jgi:sec-independent protein translocase protein TatA
MFTGLESPAHILIILLVILLLFGAKRLPELGRSLGKGINEFKQGLNTKDEPQDKSSRAVEGEQTGASSPDGGESHKEETARANSAQSGGKAQ